MAGYEAGTAFLQIVPSFQGVVEKISSQAAQWGDTAGKAFKQTFEDATKGINLGPSDSDSTRQGASSGGAFADGFRAKVDAALRALPDADVDLNDSKAEAKLDELRARLETLRGAEIGIDVSDAEALSAVEIIKGELDDLGRKSPSIRVKVDAGAASAELAAIGAEADAAGSGVGTLGEDASGGVSSLGGLTAALVVLATALIPIGGLAAGALSALPALLAGAGSGIGALKLGFSGISGAISAYTQQQGKAAAATGATGQSATSAAEQALAAAQEEQSAAQAVANAQEALANAQQSATDSVHSAQEQLIQSEQALQQAEQSEENAQRSLTQARIDAANAIVNLNDQVKDGALAVQQAQLDLATANAALTNAQDTPGTSSAALAQASLSAQEAAQHLADLQDQQQQLQQQQTASAAAGVDGSDQVINATQALGQAQQTVANDQQAQTDASNALLEAQAAAVQKVADAQTALSQAITAQADTLQRIALEAQAAGASAGGAAPAVNSFAQAMAGLTPAGRAFVNFVTQTLLPQFDAFKAQVQEALLPGITLALAAMLPLFQTIEPFILQAATGISQFAQNLAGLLTSGPGLFNLSAIFEEGAGFMRDLAKAALQLVPAFLTIGAQAAPVVKALGDGVDHIVGAFAKWVANGGFESFIRWLKDNGPTIVSSISRLVTGFGHLIVDLEPFGFGILAIVGYLTEFLGWVLKIDTEGVKAVDSFIASAGSSFGWLNTNVFQPLATFFTETLPGALTTVTSAFSGAWTAITSTVSAAWTGLVSGVFVPIGQMFTQTIPGAIGSMLGFFDSIPGRIGSALGGVFGIITGAFGNIGTWVTTNVINPVVLFFTQLPGNIASAMSAGAAAAGSALSAIGKDVVNGIINALNHIIDVIDGGLAGVSAFGFHPFGAKTIPDIPTLHSGGFVPGTSGADVPAILQAGEFVLSRSHVAALAASGGTSQPSRTLHQEITVTAFDPRTAAIETQQRSDFAAKTRGF